MTTHNNTNLRDTTILIPVRIDSTDRSDNLKMVTGYLDKYLDVNIIVGEEDIEPKVPIDLLPVSCKYIFRYNPEPSFYRTRMNNMLIRESLTPLIAIWDTDVIIPIPQMVAAVSLLRRHEAEVVSPYDGSVIGVDDDFKSMFGHSLDTDLLTLNVKKFAVGGRRAWGGAVFLDKSAFVQAGMDNEYFRSWGPEDIERIRRMKNLGYRIRRIPGDLFHLPHERFLNSSYPDRETYYDYMQEYLNICNMRKHELIRYIIGWNTDPSIPKTPCI